MKVSITIANFNGRDLLAKNLPHMLKAWENEANNIREIIVVDDGSHDDSVQFLKNNFKTVKVVKHTKNRGVSAAINTGVRTAKGELVAVINNDVVVSENFLVSTLKIFEDKKVFGVSLHEKGYSWARGEFKDGYVGFKAGVESKSIHDTFWLSGGSAVFSRALWNEVGGMDEALLSPFYWEDIDISYRAAKRGYKLLWDPEAKVVHEHESTVKKINRRYVNRIRERNQLIFIWKNITSKRLTGKHRGGLFRRIIAHPGYMIVVVSALLKFRKVMKARKKELRESKVSDEAIFARFV